MPLESNIPSEARSAEGPESLFPNWLRVGYVATNGCANTVALVAGVASGNIAVIESGLQGVAEIGISNTQMSDAHEHAHVGDKKRKRIYQAITGLSLAGAGAATGEIFELWDTSTDIEYVDAISLGASGVASVTGLVAAMTIAQRMRAKYGGWRKRKRNSDITTPEHDAIRHIVIKDLPVSVLAGLSAALGLYQQSRGLDGVAELSENILGLASGAWGAWLFRPTSNNMHHDQGNEQLPPAIEQLESI